MIDVNLLGLLYCTREALPLIRDSGGGHIVNVSSVAGRQAAFGSAVYNMTKWGVTGFSEALRQEALNSNIRVTCVEPGFVDTELHGHNEHPMVVEATEKMRDEIGTLLEAEDIARGILYAVAPGRARERQRDPDPPDGPEALSDIRFVRDSVQAVATARDENSSRTTAPPTQLHPTSAPASAHCARRWTSRCATWPSAAASAPRCCPRSRGGRPARRWRSPRVSRPGWTWRSRSCCGWTRARHVAITRSGKGRVRRRRGHAVEELTPPLPGQRADVSIHTLAVGAATGAMDDPPMHEPGSRETAVLLQGSVDLFIDGERHELGEGDSVTFDADLPHHFENNGD